jgi:NAD(P)H-hydrate epimerase
VVARLLADLAPKVFLAAERGALSKDAAVNAARLDSCGVPIVEVAGPEEWSHLAASALDCDVVVDALLGTGFHGMVHGLPGAMVETLANMRARGPAVVAVDIPSGVSDTGAVDGPAVRATVTVTFARPKRAHVFAPGSRHVGELLIADIGIPAVAVRSEALVFLIERADVLAAWPARASDAHKGDFGHLLVVGGSAGKTGAAALSALGALRAGAGLVTVATAPACVVPIAAAAPEIMTEALADSTGLPAIGPASLQAALSLADDRDAVVIGPGCGRRDDTGALIRDFVTASLKAMVVDADALFALGTLPTGTGEIRSWVLTPHPGEAARLLGAPTAMIEQRRLEAARDIAKRSGAVTVLKGERTLVADPQGRCAINPTGNPGMAKAGSGDVLAGVIGALLARGCEPWTAATAGVLVHGLAGDRAARAHGEEGALASDIAAQIGPALRDLRGAV